MVKIKDGFRGSRAIVLPASIVAEMELDNFESKLHITDIGYYPTASHHYRNRKDGISQHVLIYCTDGKGWFTVNGKTQSIAANQFFILPANIAHAYGSDSKHPWTIYWLHFKGDLAQFYANGYDVPTSIPPTDNSRITDRISIFEEIFQVLEMGYSKDNINYAISCLYYFLGSIKYIGKFRESRGKTEHSKDTVDRAMIYMKENVEKSFTLCELSTYLGYSESYVSNLFKRQTGYSPMSYMSQLKIQTACRLLDFSDMKINQICHKVGISDPYYFTKLFSKTMGCSPTAYRDKKKG